MVRLYRWVKSSWGTFEDEKTEDKKLFHLLTWLERWIYNERTVNRPRPALTIRTDRKVVFTDRNSFRTLDMGAEAKDLEQG